MIEALSKMLAMQHASVPIVSLKIIAMPLQSNQTHISAQFPAHFMKMMRIATRSVRVLTF
jgi:hypothetical protein